MKVPLPSVTRAIADCLEKEGLTLPDGPLTTMYRAEIKKNVYYSKQYERVKKRNSFTICYNNYDNAKSYGFIECFICVHNAPIAILQPIHPLPTTCKDHFNISTSCLDSVSHIIPMSVTSLVCAVLADRIIEKCLFLEFGSNKYIVKFPSRVTFD